MTASNVGECSQAWKAKWALFKIPGFVRFLLSSPTPPHSFYLRHFSQGLRGCLHEKTHTSASFSPEWPFWFPIAFTWWQGHFISRYLKVHFMLIKYTCDSKSQTLRMHYPFQSTGRPISHRNGWSILVYTIPLQEILAPVQQPGWTHAGVTHAGMTFCGGITLTNIESWEGTGGELALGRKSPWHHVNTPLDSHSSFSALKPHENTC